MGLFKIIKNHPKKTLLAVTAISYAYNYVSQKYRYPFALINFIRYLAMIFCGVTFVIWSR